MNQEFEGDVGDGVFRLVKEELSDEDEDLASKSNKSKRWPGVFLTRFELEGTLILTKKKTSPIIYHHLLE